MIPIAVLAGLVVGRWWVLPIAGVGFAIVLVASGTANADWGTAAGGGVLAIANAGVGCAIHKCVAGAFRAARAAITRGSTY